MKHRTRPVYDRSFPLDDIEVARSGDGRTVTAYCAMFGSAYEVRDVHGHYFESIARSAFDRTLARGIKQVQCLWNHGRTLEGTPSDRFSMPVGTPIEIKPDGRGLLTVTRYAKTPLGDEALELIREGAVTTQSFRGGIYRTSARPHQSGLQLLERTELGLRDYGPAPFAVNTDAEILSVRSTTELLEEIGELSEDERAQLLAALQTPPAGSEPPATPQQNPDPPSELGADDEPPATPSGDGPSVAQYEARLARLRHEP